MARETRTIDDLHRIALPKKMCEAIDIKIGDTVEITLVDEHIVLKKWGDSDYKKVKECWTCKHKEFQGLAEAVCGQGHRGMITPHDSCEYWEDDGK